jgi:4-hydroxy-4-methyl-2-oxoglutarate aldolase
MSGSRDGEGNGSGSGESHCAAWSGLSPTTIADCLPRSQIVDPAIRPMWPQILKVAGPAYTVRCARGDNLMLHAAIYRAPAGAVVVVEGGDADHALAGGNVCAVAQRNGIAGFVLDGAVRDIAEIRASRFPVFAKAVIPKPGTKDTLGALEETVVCGGVRVAPGDIVVGDEEGIVIVPRADRANILAAARKRAAADAAQTLDAWEQDHRRRIDAALAAKGFVSR